MGPGGGPSKMEPMDRSLRTRWVPGSQSGPGQPSNRGSMGDQLLVLLLLADSGNPGLQVLMGGPENLHVATLVGLLLILAFRKGVRVSSLAAVPFLIFGTILIAQGLSFEFFPRITIMGFMVKLAIAGLVCLLVPCFSLAFVRVMGILCGLSLLFWILGFIEPWKALVSAHALRGSGADLYPRLGIIVHTYISGPEGFGTRNGGMFWEPGAFAGYLTLALILLACQRRILASRTYVRYLVLFTAGILSTQSTAGYLALLGAYGVGELTRTPKGALRLSVGEKRWTWLPAAGVLLLAVGLLVMWNRVDFLGPKIRRQYEQAVSQSSARWYMTRFGTVILDWEYIRRRPLTGWGLHDRTRWALDGGVYHDRGAGMGNDLSGFTARFGALGMLTFLGLTFLGFQKLTGGTRSVSFAAAGTILLILNGEAFLEHPAFLSLMFPALVSGGLAPRRQRDAMPSWRGAAMCAAGGASLNPARRIMRCQIPR